MRKVFKKSKRIVASLLAAGLLLQSVPVYAATGDPTFRTELENDEALMDGRTNESQERSHYYDPSTQRERIAASYGNGSTTAYKFGWIIERSSGFTGWKFDLNGLLDTISEEPQGESQEGYVISDNAGGPLSLTYKYDNPQGFSNTVGFGATPGSTIDLGRYISTTRSAAVVAGNTNFYPGKDGEFRNGEVVKVYDRAGNDRKLELRISIKPSHDKKFILAEYTVYNANLDPNNGDPLIVDSGRRSSEDGDGGRTFWISSGTDVMVATHDSAPIWSTDKGNYADTIEGIHGQSNNGATYNLAAFDILSYHPQYKLGIQKRDASDPSKITTWVGNYTNYYQNNYTDAINTSYMPGGTFGSTDSGLTYSLRFDLLPGETKTGTLAFSMRGPTYYVDPDYQGERGSSNGFLSTPYRSIKDAVRAIGLRTPKKAYIFVTKDMAINETIEIPANKDITIQTTDYVWDDTTNSKTAPYPIGIDPATKIRTNSIKIKRGSTLEGPLFKVANANSTLTFGDIVLDGQSDVAGHENNTSPLVEATAGLVQTQSGAIFRNNKIKANGTAETYTDANGNGAYDAGEAFTDGNGNGVWDASSNVITGSAIDISGTANLNMDYGEISGNTSYQGSAINMSGSGSFKIGNGVVVYGNKNEAGGAANVMLGENQSIQVTEPLTDYAKIGVGVKIPPTNASEEREVAVKASSGETLPYALSQFPADKAPGQWTDLATNENVVLKTGAFAYTVSYVREDTGATLAANVNETKVAGTPIALDPMNLEPAGYVYDSVEITPSTHGLSVNNSTGSIAGSMPGSDVSIVYKYVRNAGIATFFSNGGNPSNIPDIVSAAGGEPSSSMPIVTRTGYDFRGWFKMTDVDGDGFYTEGTDTLAGAPTTALANPVVRGHEYFVAQWDISANTYAFDVKHKNNNSSIPLTFKTEAQAHVYTDGITASPITIPGYVRLRQTANPISSGRFNETSANFTGTMPIGDVNVQYIYRVDPSERFNYRVIHKTSSGVVLSDTTVARSAEATISAAPMSTLGYRLANARVVNYTVSGTPGIVKTVQEMQAAAGITADANGMGTDNAFSANMPNQDVTVEYIYDATSDYFAIQTFTDTTSNERIGSPNALPFNRDAAVNIPFTGKYGYLFHSASVTPSGVGIFNANGDFNAPMMPAANIRLNYNLNRDPNLWKTVTYAVANAPYDKGSVSTPNTYSFLINDGSADGALYGHTFRKMQELRNVPETTANPQPYYKFDGWYTDPDGTTKVTDDMTFSGDVTLYAKFVEDPTYWVDINFAAGTNGSIGTPASLHTYYDNTWADITSELPSSTPVANYLFKDWSVGGVTVTPSTNLVNGETYTANFKKDPAIWGTNPGHIDAVGRLASDGSGEVKVTGVVADNVYILTDLDGNIISVIQAPAGASNILFEDVVPGSRYHVYEGTPDTVATVGDSISNATGSTISSPKEVLIPAIDDNYVIGYDENNEDKVKIVVNPADPDADYALVDKDGNIVAYPDSDNGWKTPVGSNPATVTFDNLDPKETYTVVARKKGDTGVSPLNKVPEGKDVITNPGDEFEVATYIVETIGGEIATVAGDPVALNRYENTKVGDVVELHADFVDANGMAFKYWKVINGHNSAVTGNITDNDFTFTMEATNVVLRAVYERSLASPSNANVEEEIRGGAKGDFALNPNDLSRLEEELTTGVDRSLIDVNGADVTYKIVFNKRNVKTTEKNVVRDESSVATDHPDAFTTAWALDIFADRYVDGRKVGRATDSDASFEAIIQLNAADIDMLDYELYDVETGVAVPVATLVTTDGDPETTAGLFKFTATVGHSYVLVYSKAYKVTFIDNNPALDHEDLNNMQNIFFERFKVRKQESVEDTFYATEYAVVQAYADGATPGTLKTPFEDIYGVQYDYVDWSKKANALSAFDTTTAITKNTVVYAYYNNNKPAVDNARVNLTDLVAEANIFKNSPYIKANTASDLEAAIDNAQQVLDQYRGDAAGNLRQANYAELQAAFDLLKAVLDRAKAEADAASNAYSNRTGGGSGGGSGSSGRGKGTNARGFEGTAEKLFTLGVNGYWEQDATTGRYRFVVNGGLPLNSTWGKIQYRDEATGKLLTSWYYFDGHSYMATGWIYDPVYKNWYYLNPAAGEKNGQMLVGWFQDVDKNWYFLDGEYGHMYRGWHKIGEKWYYFATTRTADGRPEGSLYINTTTPDGYRVNGNGEWVE